jgi:hypothetical protein
MIVHGSNAMAFGLNALGKGLGREPVDLDIMALPEEIPSLVRKANLTSVKSTGKFLYKAPDGKMVEIDPIILGSSNHMYWKLSAEVMKFPVMQFYGIDMEVAPLEMCYSLKKSHRHSPRFFEKTVKDYNLLRKHLQGRDILARITDARTKETIERERLRTPSLNKTAKDFFDDNVSNRTFIHDQIHEVMAFGSRPMFERIQIEPGKVACSKEKFNKLPERKRIQCVQEEAYVIALERAIIPMLFEGAPIANPTKAYQWAVMRICTTLCSGWFREFAVENHDQLIGVYYYNPNYVDKFLTAVENGKIERVKAAA